LGDASKVAAQLPVTIRLSFNENKTLGVHLPMKIGGAIFDACIVFMM